jgi:hypothetical protein
MTISKCKNTGKQVRGPSISWSDNDEPVLYSSPIRIHIFEMQLSKGLDLFESTSRPSEAGEI